MHKNGDIQLSIWQSQPWTPTTFSMSPDYTKITNQHLPTIKQTFTWFVDVGVCEGVSWYQCVCMCKYWRLLFVTLWNWCHIGVWVWCALLVVLTDVVHHMAKHVICHTLQRHKQQTYSATSTTHFITQTFGTNIDIPFICVSEACCINVLFCVDGDALWNKCHQHHKTTHAMSTMCPT